MLARDRGIGRRCRFNSFGRSTPLTPLTVPTVPTGNVAQSWAFGKSPQCASAKRAVGWPWMAHAKTIAMVFERDDRKSRKRI